MEHRRSSRRLLRQEVGLHASRLGPVSGYTHDLSLGGMFVETRPLALPPNLPVTVSFALRTNGKETAFVLDAAVVRCDANGVGLMFLQMDPEMIRTLSGALAAHYEAGSH